MAKIVRYKNGFKGFASDKVAAILEKKGEAKIIGDAAAKPEAEKPASDKAKA